MSIFEAVSAVLGILGFLLGVVNLILRLNDRKTTLRCTVTKEKCIHGKWTVKGIVTNREEEGSIIDFVLGIANTSQRNNSVSKIDCKANHPLKPVPEQPVRQGENSVENLTDHPIATNIWWQKPDKEWSLLTPHPIPPGSNIEASVCYRIPGPPIPPDKKISLKVLVKDSFGKTYTKKFNICSEGFKTRSTILS